MIRDEELAYLESGGRCETCPHYTRLHHEETEECPIDWCDCGLKRFEKRHAGHTLTTIRTVDGMIPGVSQSTCRDCNESYTITG